MYVHDGQSETLLQVLKRMYTAVFLVQLETNTATCLFDTASIWPQEETLAWDSFFADFSRQYIGAHRRQQACETFSCQGIQLQYKYGKTSFSFTYPYIGDTTHGKVMITAVFEETEDQYGKTVCVLFHQPGQENLLSRIVDIYVYDMYDYFIYLDAKNDTYITLGTGKLGTPLPPATAQHYSEEIVTYAREYVVPEDQDRVIAEMELPRVLAQLEAYGVHSVTAGVIDPVRGYTRKKVEYRYCNKKEKSILLSCTDITDMYMEQKRQVKELQRALQQARTDTLTGILNYQGIVYYTNQFLEQDGAAGTFIFLDLDNFKSVNDTYGHQMGDTVLQKVAKTLQGIVIQEDYVARIGGDEFVVFVKDVVDLTKVETYAATICTNIAALTDTECAFKDISCSVGVALAPRDGETYASLCKVADDLVYESKKRGKNQYSLRK